jgi:hypothetical protein
MTLHRIKEVPRCEWMTTSVAEVMLPLEQSKRTEPDTELWTALQQMDRDGVNQLPVTRDDQVIGIKPGRCHYFPTHVTGTRNITGRNNGRTVERRRMKRAILAMDPNNPTLRVESKKSLRVLGSLGSECCQTHAAKVRDECSSLADERGFAAFGAV